jgi:predicted Zn-dependent protease
MTKAVENYQKAAETLASSTDPTDKTLGKRSLEFLVAAYRADKLNDPAKAEPVVQKMIQLEPGEPTNYFALATIYEEAGVYDEAENILQAARKAKPSDPAVYLTLASYYNRQGQFDKTIEALEERAAKEPNNPEAFYTISVYYWEKAYRDFKLTEKEKKSFVDKGRSRRRQGAQAQAGLCRSDRLQGPPPSPAGEPGKDPASSSRSSRKPKR